MKKVFMLLLLLIFTISGCAQKKLSREEQLAIQERNSAAAVQIYEGFTVDDIAQAAEKVLYLIDPGFDTDIKHLKNSVVSHRRYMIYMVLSAVMGVDTWVVRIEEKTPTIHEVSVAADGVFAGLIMPSPVSVEDTHPNSTKLPEASAKLFFERLDYFLGKQAVWRSCKNSEAWAKHLDYFTDPHEPLAFICNGVGIEDKTPEYLEK